MSLWIQQGYGKGSKLEDIAAAAELAGVVLSPNDEEAEVLQATARHVEDLGMQVLVDPQTYVYSIPDGSSARHESHGIDFGAVHWSMSPSEVADHVEAVVLLNENLGCDTILSPTCVQRGVSDVWTPLALQYARATLSAAADKDVLISLAIDESAFSDWEGVEQWLDVLTSLDCNGFYFLVARSTRDYPYAWDDSRLRNVLRFIFRLAVLNDYELLWGYSDIEGLVGLAAGASGIASGWHYGQRLFSESRWQPFPGHPRQPVPRVTSPSLLTPLKSLGEADTILETDLAKEAIPSKSVRDQFDDEGADSWSRPQAQVQHLIELGNLADSLTDLGKVSDRADQCREWLESSLNLWNRLRDEGVALPSLYRSRLQAMLVALDGYTLDESI